MGKKNDIDDKVLAAFPGLDAEQIKLLCLMAYLGDAPGNYALKQLYGRNYASAMQKLALLDHTPYTRGGKVAPAVYFDVVGTALDNFDIPGWAGKAQQFRTETATWLWDGAVPFKEVL